MKILIFLLSDSYNFFILKPNFRKILTCLDKMGVPSLTGVPGVLLPWFGRDVIRQKTL